MAVTEIETHHDLHEAPRSAADLRGVLLPIGLVQDIPTDLPDAETLKADAHQLGASFRDTIATVLDVPSGEVTNHFIELTGEVPIQGHPEGYPTKKETVQVGAMQLYKPGTTERDGMQYIMRRITSVNGSQALEVATVSLPDSGEPYVMLERTSTYHGQIDAKDSFHPNTHTTLVGVQEMFNDLQQAVEKRDAGLEVTRVAPIRVAEVDSGPKVSKTAERAANSVPLRTAAARLAASHATAVFEHLPRGSVDLVGADGSNYEIQTVADGMPTRGTEIRMRKRTPDGNRQWAGLSVPFRGERRPASIAFSVQGAPTREAIALRAPYPRSGLLVDFKPDSPEAVQGGLDLAREIHAGVQSGRIKRKPR